jgi:hypothetical protein
LAILWESERDTAAIGLQPIQLVSECLNYVSEFFQAPPDWGGFFCAVVDDDGWLYVLAASSSEYMRARAHGASPNDLHLYVYNAGGGLESRTSWPHLPDLLTRDLFLTTDFAGFVAGDMLVHVVSSEFVGEAGFVVVSMAGEIVLAYENGMFENDEFVTGVVGGGYFYGMFRHPFYRDENFNLTRRGGVGYTVRKLSLPSGSIVWENSWYEDTGMIETILICPHRQFLYLYSATQLYIFDENTSQLHQARDLTNSGFRVMQRVTMASVSAASVLSDGRLHFVFSHLDNLAGVGGNFSGFSEWIFTPLVDDYAVVRLNEIAENLSDTTVIRFFDTHEDMSLTGGTQGDLFVFADSVDALVELTFLPTLTDGAFATYTQTLNTELFAGTANWDIVIIPGTFLQYGNFALGSFADRGMFENLLPMARYRFVENDERYYTHLFEALLHDGGLYFIPGGVNVPFVLVPRRHERAEYLKNRSQSWTWAEFLTIAQQLKAESGVPPISSFSDVPQFFLFDEPLLLDLGRGERLGDFSNALELYAALVDSSLNHTSLSVFTFACIRAITGNYDFHETHTILPLPSMRGERIFYSLGVGHAVLTVGESPYVATEFVIYNFEESINRPFRYFERISSLIRPNEADITRFMSMTAFLEYEAVINKANAYIWLPTAVRLAISDAVVQYVHGALSRDAAVQRVADIMWIFVNE